MKCPYLAESRVENRKTKGPITMANTEQKRRNISRKKGFTLVEAMIGLLIFLIIALGILTYRYSAKLNVLKAKQHLTATDLATTFIETWQGFSGAEIFDPSVTFSTDLSISAGTGSGAPSGYTLLGTYDVLDDDKNYQLTLSWKDAGNSLRELNVIVRWSYINESSSNTYQLTTYADQS